MNKRSSLGEIKTVFLNPPCLFSEDGCHPVTIAFQYVEYVNPTALADKRSESPPYRLGVVARHINYPCPPESVEAASVLASVDRWNAGQTRQRIERAKCCRDVGLASVIPACIWPEGRTLHVGSGPMMPDDVRRIRASRRESEGMSYKFPLLVESLNHTWVGVRKDYGIRADVVVYEDPASNSICVGVRNHNGKSYDRTFSAYFRYKRGSWSMASRVDDKYVSGEGYVGRCRFCGSRMTRAHRETAVHHASVNEHVLKACVELFVRHRSERPAK